MTRRARCRGTKQRVSDEKKECPDALGFVTANLAELKESLPRLIDRVRELAYASGRGGQLVSLLPDPDAERERIESLVTYLERFGRADTRPTAALDLGRVLEAALDLVGGEIARRGRLVKRFAPAPRVLATERQLGQLFLSLLINAAQALPAGQVDDNRVEVCLDTRADGWARVAIEDSGHGIPEDLLPHIFEPFFSTKRGAGAGIGLAIVRDTIQSLGGGISVASKVGHGARFEIALPPAPPTAQPE